MLRLHCQAGGEPVEEAPEEDAALPEELLSDFEVDLPDSYDTLSAEASAPHDDDGFLSQQA